MKNKLTGTTLVLFFALISLGARAQFEVGAAGGISVPNLTSSGKESTPLNTGYKSRLGPEFGLVGEYHFSTLFSIEGKILYSAQGGKKDGLQAFTTPPEAAAYFESQGMQAPPYLYADYNSEAKINYLRVPILAKVGWDFSDVKAPHFRLSVAAGPFVGFLLSAKQVTSGNSPVYLDEGGTQQFPGGPQSFNQTTDIKSDLHNANFGIDGNLGLAYVFNVNKIFLELGGNYGFLNIQKGSENGKNNSGAATVLLGYTYRLGR